MNTYVLSVIGVVLVSAVLTAILPEGKTNGIIKSITKVACVLTIVAPIIEYFGGNKNVNSEEIFAETVINSDLNFIDYCSKISVENAKGEIEKSIREEFGREITVELLWEYDNGQTQLFGSAYEDRKIKIYRAILKTKEELNVEAQRSIVEWIKKTGIDEVEFVSTN